jgi:hypothetical protein
MGIERYVDRTICGVKSQKSSYIEGSLNFAILALGDDGLSRDRLMEGQLRGSNQVQSGRISSRSLISAYSST